jgi:hypothetical protein
MLKSCRYIAEVNALLLRERQNGRRRLKHVGEEKIV